MQSESQSTLELLNNQLARYQAIISRLAGNSVQVKTWCFTGTAALAALAIDHKKATIWVVSMVLLAAFFYLDAYYLSLEQHFRAASNQLAEDVAQQRPVDRSRFLAIKSSAITWHHVLACGVKSHTALIYFVVAVGLVTGFVGAI